MTKSENWMQFVFVLQGYISLSDPSISHKGYHIPNKGTVQLVRQNV